MWRFVVVLENANDVNEKKKNVHILLRKSTSSKAPLSFAFFLCIASSTDDDKFCAPAIVVVVAVFRSDTLQHMLIVALFSILRTTHKKKRLFRMHETLEEMTLFHI